MSNSATRQGRETPKGVLLSPGADSVPGWGEGSRGDTPAHSRRAPQRLGVGRGQGSIRERAELRMRRRIPPASGAVLTHSHAWVSEGHLQSDLRWEGITFCVIWRSDKK